MKIVTVGQMKRGQTVDLDKKPREGTDLRELYDFFMERKGEPVNFAATNEKGNRTYRRLTDLQDRYGLDIRKLSRGCWVLAGEWRGSQYIDYIAEKVK